MEMSRFVPSSGDMRRIAGTRNGMLAVALLVALVAGVLLLMFLSRYRDSVNDTSPVTVLVAKSLIEKGSSGDVVVSSGMFEASRITQSEEAKGAITDPAVLRHQYAVADVFP